MKDGKMKEMMNAIVKMAIMETVEMEATPMT